MKRRLAGLALIARLDDRRMQAAAAELAPLLDRAVRLEAEAKDVDRRRLEEGRVDLVEAMPYLGRFLATLRREGDRIAAERVVVEQAVEAKRDEVVDAWRDLRSKEHLRDSLMARARRAQLQAEQAQADEGAGQAHARRMRISRRTTAPE